MHIWWLGQSGFLVQIAGRAHPARPVSLGLADRAVRRHRHAARAHHRPRRRAVAALLRRRRHLEPRHQDHLDPGTLPQVLSGDAAFVCAAGSEDVAAERAGRLPDAALGIGDDATFGGFRIEAVPAYHEGAPEAVGYVVRNGALRHLPLRRQPPRPGNGRGRCPARRRRRLRADQRRARQHGRRRRRPARLRGRGADRDPLPPRDVPVNTASTSRFVAECARIGQEYRLPRAGERITIDYGF